MHVFLTAEGDQSRAPNERDTGRVSAWRHGGTGQTLLPPLAPGWGRVSESCLIRNMRVDGHHAGLSKREFYVNRHSPAVSFSRLHRPCYGSSESKITSTPSMGPWSCWESQLRWPFAAGPPHRPPLWRRKREPAALTGCLCIAAVSVLRSDADADGRAEQNMRILRLPRNGWARRWAQTFLGCAVDRTTTAADEVALCRATASPRVF